MPSYIEGQTQHSFSDLSVEDARVKLKFIVDAMFLRVAIHRDNLHETRRLNEKNRKAFKDAEGLDPAQYRKKILSEVVVVQSTEKLDAPRVQIVAPAGIGKTTTVLANLSKCLGMNVFFMLPTIGLAKELFDKISRNADSNVFLIEGRNQKMCQRHELAQKIGNKGMDVQKTLCANGESLCPHFTTCLYQKQIVQLAELREKPLDSNDPPRLFLITHGYLTSNSALPTPDLVIVDESHWQSFLLITDDKSNLKPRDFSITELRSFAEDVTLNYGPFLQVIDALEQAVNKNHRVIPLLMKDEKDEDWKEAIQLLKDIKSASEKIVSKPSYADDKIEVAIASSKIPRLNLAIRLLEGLWHEVKIRKPKSTSLTYNPELGLLRLKIIKNNMIPHEVPVLLIDASADLEINRLIWGQRLESYEIKAKRNAEIIQVSNRTFSKFSLGIGPSGAKDWQASEDQIKFRNELIDFVGELAGQSDEQVLVVASKGIIGSISGKLSQNVVTAHYGALRGLNAFEHIKTAIIIGREEPQYKAIEDMTQALLSFSDKTLLLSQNYYKTTKQVCMKNGDLPEVEVSVHVDNLAQRVLEQIREQEISQAIDRLRLLNTGEKKTVYLLTSIVVDADIDQHLSWEKMAHLSRMDKAIQFAFTKAKAFPTGDRDILSAAPVGLWSTQNMVGGDIRRRGGIKWVVLLIKYYMGNDPLSVVSYRRLKQRGRPSTAIVSANEPDLQDALQRVLGHEVTIIKIEKVE